MKRLIVIMLLIAAVAYAQEDAVKDLSIRVNLDETLYLGVDYDNLFRVQNNDHVAGVRDKVNLTMFYNITLNNTAIKQETLNITGLNAYKTAGTGEIRFEETGNYSICGRIISASFPDNNTENNRDCKDVIVINTEGIACNASISLTTEKTVYENNEQIKFHNRLSDRSYPYEIEYWIEDIFERIVKEKRTTENTNQKSFTPDIKEQDKALIFKNRIKNILCNNTNDNIASQKLVIIKGELPQENSSITIENIDSGKDKKLFFGETAKIRINVYKGNTGARVVKLWMQSNKRRKITDIMTFYFNDKYSSQIIRIPLKLKDDCEDNLKAGNYTVRIRGLGIETRKEIIVHNKKCRAKTEPSATNTSKELLEYSLIDHPLNVSSNDYFKIKLKIKNNDESKHSIRVWSYVYRGSKSYSGQREANAKEIIIDAGSSKTIEQRITLESMVGGDYKLKVKILPDNRKTAHEITESINVREAGRKPEPENLAPSISRLYTNTKRYKRNINLFASIENPESNLTLALESMAETRIIKLNSSRKKALKFNVTVSKGKNSFFLKLLRGNMTIDIKDLVLVISNSTIRTLNSQESLLYKASPYVSSEGYDIRKPATLATSALVYESTTTKAASKTPYFIILALSLLAIILIVRKNP